MQQRSRAGLMHRAGAQAPVEGNHPQVQGEGNDDGSLLQGQAAHGKGDAPRQHGGEQNHAVFQIHGHFPAIVLGVNAELAGENDGKRLIAGQARGQKPHQSRGPEGADACGQTFHHVLEAVEQARLFKQRGIGGGNGHDGGHAGHGDESAAGKHLQLLQGRAVAQKHGGNEVGDGHVLHQKGVRTGEKNAHGHGLLDVDAQNAERENDDGGKQHPEIEGKVGAERIRGSFGHDVLRACEGKQGVACAGHQERDRAAAQHPLEVAVDVGMGQCADERRAGGHGRAAVSHVDAAQNGSAHEDLIEAGRMGHEHADDAERAYGAEGRADERTERGAEQEAPEHEEGGVDEGKRPVDEHGNGAADAPDAGHHADEGEYGEDVGDALHASHEQRRDFGQGNARAAGVGAEADDAEEKRPEQGKTGRDAHDKSEHEKAERDELAGGHPAGRRVLRHDGIPEGAGVDQTKSSGRATTERPFSSARRSASSRSKNSVLSA